MTPLDIYEQTQADYRALLDNDPARKARVLNGVQSPWFEFPSGVRLCGYRLTNQEHITFISIGASNDR